MTRHHKDLVTPELIDYMIKEGLAPEEVFGWNPTEDLKIEEVNE